jgi:hypothetical protein
MVQDPEVYGGVEVYSFTDVLQVIIAGKILSLHNDASAHRSLEIVLTKTKLVALSARAFFLLKKGYTMDNMTSDNRFQHSYFHHAPRSFGIMNVFVKF